MCGAGKVLCSYACVLHDWCLALAPARCVSVSLHRLLLPLSARDCLRGRPKLTGVHDVCKRKKTSVMPGDEVLKNRSYFLIFAHRCSGFRCFFFTRTHARFLQMGARRLSRYLICIQIFVASDLFFYPCTKMFGLQIRFLMSAPRQVGFRAYF